MAAPLIVGASGRAVVFLQARLGLAQSGQFDASVATALRQWQEAHGMTPDGVYGSQTNAVMTARALPDIADAAARLNVDTPALQAIIQVETTGSGFLPDGRPRILLERHKVWAATSPAQRVLLGAQDCNPTPGGYATGPDANARGAGEWVRFERVAAVTGDEVAAQCCSWGLGQVMGANYATCGFTNAVGLMFASALNERAQLDVMVRFALPQAGLLGALRAHQWAAVARIWNGPNFAINQYDTKLSDAYTTLTSR
ncbi:gp27 [Burkholderia phage Bcep43]|uniref:Gp27 n=2 Tax=Naesvirus TaxID=2733115 RepID=Q6UKC4_9CAUD|nr:endolysin [Burkholderia phage Bcep781]NP_958132.2 endolysin [Burkholderia phage Bcep43]AAN38028.1 gp27 [Burkholderia phage Bcep781]AAR89318.2 gp27 [Burkholderia phage Bcep43]